MTGRKGRAGVGAIALLLPATLGAAVPPSGRGGDAPPPSYAPRNSPSPDPRLREVEDAVRRAPQNAPARLALGAAYLAAGRFLSAEQVLNDAVRLDPDTPGADMRLVLAQIAVGKKNDAIARLSVMKTASREADIGLALALVGETGKARELLSEAARDDRATPRLRQNLAFVEAFAGNWANAAAIAAQDVPAEQMADRLRRWAVIAQLGDAPAFQIGALIGVVPQDDPGMPLNLALARTDSDPETVALASADGVAPSVSNSDAAQSDRQEPVRPAAYSGPPRMRGLRSGESDLPPQSRTAAPVSTSSRSLYRAGSRRGMTVSTRANRFPVRLAAVCASDAMPVLGRGRLQKISFATVPRRARKSAPERSA